MLPKKYAYVGKITKVFGIDGSLLITNLKEDFLNFNEEFVFIEINNKQIPFFIIDKDIQQSSIVIRLEGIDTREDAKSFLKKNVFIASKQKDINQNNYENSDIIGFEVIDNKGIQIGFLDDIIELPEQLLLSILHKNKEILIPFVDEIIENIDFQDNKIIINPPEGLIDIYLE